MTQKRSTMQKLISSLVPDARHLVTWIEAQQATTKDYYGAYMSVLSQVQQPALAQILACALIDAGANRAGVRAACIALDLVKPHNISSWKEVN